MEIWDQPLEMRIAAAQDRVLVELRKYRKPAYGVPGSIRTR
jgi:hypothetical protein